MADVLVLVEHTDGEADELSLQAIALAQGYAQALGGGVTALLIGAGGARAAGALGAHGVIATHVAGHEALDDPSAFAPDAWAATLCELIERLAVAAALAAGSDRGNEVLARAAARLDQPMAANCTRAAPDAGSTTLTRLRWGGSLLEEASLVGSPALFTVAPHAIAAEGAGDQAGAGEIEAFTPALGEGDLRVRVSERVAAASGGVSLADATVVVSGGRGVGSSEGFAVIEELAALTAGRTSCRSPMTA